jgi:anti-sigma-K factor RskA
MNCREVEELIPAYLLGALDEKEQAVVETHIRECPTCLALFHEQSPAITLLSRVGDSLQAPSELKQRVLGIVDTGAKPRMQRDTAKGIMGFLRSSLRQPIAATVMALATISLVALSLGTLLLWLEVRDLKEGDSQLSVALRDELEQMEMDNQTLSQMLFNQLDMAYIAAMPGISTLILEGSEAAPRPRGMLMVSPHATWAVLEALNLQPLPEDQAYQLWFVTNGSRKSGGVFTVNETGYGQLMVQGLGLITSFHTMGVSIEPAQGSAWPTGTNVLWGTIAPTDSP